MTRLCAMLASLLLAVAVSAVALADTYVRGYYRSDGTYVTPHWRSSPDGSYNNNWSVSPNVNPYTGKRGTRSPTWNDRPPSGGGGLQPFRPYEPYEPYRPSGR